MAKSYIYIKGLKHVDHTVFCVEKEQKTYWDEQFQQSVAYSSGQQIKRTIMEELLSFLGEEPAPITFYFYAPNLDEKEVVSPADPRYSDQLIGGWMIAHSKAKNRTIKRRSPLSISAMRPLHPLLSNVHKENLTFDRSDKPEIHKSIVKDKNGNILNEKEVNKLLLNVDRSIRRKWIPDKTRTSGLFVYDIAIDLRTLFCISINQLEPELSSETIDRLKEEGWHFSKNVFGPCLVVPENRRNSIINALAHALINWRITTNQARTFSPMETLAIALSDSADKIAGAIRAKLTEETEKQRAIPIIDDTSGAELFIALPCDGYISGIHGTAHALEQAEERIKNLLLDYDYEKQI
ncbi:MAG: hypothetical protein JXR46_06715 [Calditrichaceae bacterium]|nr:hypothetical protein [Calditrichaceae bacterium]MBN2708721.1 hypothetical protein [Calditrichaceae bacterium]RQV92156.1 MAG: CRISPR-associated protein Cas7 [Calditrichota bacterium]